MPSKYGRDLNQLNQMFGAFQISLKNIYKEVVSLHADRMQYIHYLKRLSADFDELRNELNKFEKKTFIERMETK